MKLFRLTRHPITFEQVRELRRIFGNDVEIVEVSETVPNAERVKEIVETNGADILETVLPLPLLAELVGTNGLQIPVIRSVTKRVFEADGNKATFAFSHYERIVKVEVVTEKL